MNNKKKRKQHRKLLPLVMVAFVLMSMMAMSVSAAEYNYAACEHAQNSPGSCDFYFMGLKYFSYNCYECEVPGGDLYYTKIVPSSADLCSMVEPVNGSFDSVELDEDGYLVVRGEIGHSTDRDCDVHGNEEYYADFVGYTNPKYLQSNDDKGMVGQMINSIVIPIGGVLAGVGSAVVDFFSGSVVNNGHLSTFAIWALAFLGVGFGFGVIKFITKIVRR